jgi:predicted acylesterase/phospholipase RssA
MLLPIAATLLILAVKTLSADGKCRVLALRGGGVHGSFEVGVIKAFVEKLDPIDVQYDIVSGVSIGALIAS